MRTAREVFEHIAEALNQDQSDGSASIFLDDDLVEYLEGWKKEIEELAAKR